MSGWLLVITLLLPGQPSQHKPVGVMVDEQSCQIAGAGMVAVLESASPGADLEWTCLQSGEPA